jgi:hypothetical protein
MSKHTHAFYHIHILTYLLRIKRAKSQRLKVDDIDVCTMHKSLICAVVMMAYGEASINANVELNLWHSMYSSNTTKP